MSKNTELAVPENAYGIAALNVENLEGSLSSDEIAEEMGGETPQLPVVKIPSGGGLAFEVPGDDPEDPEIVKSLRGVIAFHHNRNAYWYDSKNKGTPPDCAAFDGVHGIGNPDGACPKGASADGLCNSCSLNEFGSGEGGKGKACKNSIQLYMLLEGENYLPVVFQLPPTSLKRFRSYVSSLLCRRRKVCDVITEITLSKAENRDGDVYSLANFKMAGVLDDATKQVARATREGIRAMVMSGFDVAAESYTSVNDEGMPL